MTCELVHSSYSWPEWQAVKLSLHPVCSTSLSFPILFSPSSNKVCSISFQSILFSVLKDLSTVFFFQLLTWTSQGKSTPLKRTPPISDLLKTRERDFTDIYPVGSINLSPTIQISINFRSSVELHVYLISLVHVKS